MGLLGRLFCRRMTAKDVSHWTGVFYKWNRDIDARTRDLCSDNANAAVAYEIGRAMEAAAVGHLCNFRTIIDNNGIEHDIPDIAADLSERLEGIFRELTGQELDAKGQVRK